MNHKFIPELYSLKTGSIKTTVAKHASLMQGLIAGVVTDIQLKVVSTAEKCFPWGIRPR